jgi:molybdopterin synthase sulfur carrier subunit
VRHVRPREAVGPLIGRLAKRDEWYGAGMALADDTVTVRLFAGLERRSRDGRPDVVVPAALAPTVAALVECLGLPGGAAGLVLVNGLHARPDAALRPGDEVSLFPPLGGG